MVPIWGVALAAVVGIILGAAAAWAAASRRLRRGRQEEDRLRRELSATRRRLGELEEVCDRALDLSARGIEDPARGAHRAWRGRTDAQTFVVRAIEELDRAIGGARVTATTAEVDAFARQMLTGVEEQGTRMGALVSETESLARTAEQASGAAIAVVDVVSEMERIADGLTTSSDATAQATAQMDDALRRGQGGAGDTAQISAKVATEAERGYRAVHKTLDEIERIRDLSETARKRIDALGSRVVGIGDVVRVIQEIAERTNLLALNASIIAAQAGEHGRSFAVVAQEIKALAQKTGASTKQISEQIRGVQEESERAMEAMATGVTAVSEGFAVALGAGDALGEIRQSARVAQKKVQLMMRAMDEQGAASSRVIEAAGTLAQRAQLLAHSVRDHTRHRERLNDLARGVAESASRAARMAHEQLDKGIGVQEGLTRLGSEVAAIVRGRKDLRRHLDRLHHAATQLVGMEEEVSGRLAAMNEAAAQLREELAKTKAS